MMTNPHTKNRGGAQIVATGQCRVELIGTQCELCGGLLLNAANFGSQYRRKDRLSGENICPDARPTSIARGHVRRNDPNAAIGNFTGSHGRARSTWIPGKTP